jgi:hypothetical protein
MLQSQCIEQGFQDALIADPAWQNRVDYRQFRPSIVTQMGSFEQIAREKWENRANSPLRW